MLMPVVIFVCIAGSLGLVAAAFTLGRPKAVSFSARLQQQTAETTVSLRDAEEMDKSLVNRLLLPLASKWAKRFAVITPAKMIASSDQAIAEAGMMGKITGVQLTTLSWMLAGGLPLFIGFLFMPQVVRGSLSMGMLLGICAVCLILGYRLPIGIVGGRAKKRKHEIQIALAFTFDLISISVQAGMAFDGAMAVVAERTKGALSDELRRTLREINLGIARDEALGNLARRTGVDDLRSFITAVNYISKLGGSLVDVIKVQTDSLRVKRRQRAETKANQAPVKIMIPLVLFILPCLFIVILGPAALSLLGGKASV